MGTSLFPSLSGGGSGPTTVPVPVDEGGTGVVSLTSNGVLVGNGTSDVTVTAEGASATFLAGVTGSDPIFRSIADADVPDNITINGTNNVTWASVNKSGSSLADLATRVISNLQSSTSAELAGVLSDETGTGVAVFSIAPSFGGALNLTTTSTDGSVLQNTTAATGGATVQISPRYRISGTGWDSDDSVSRTVSFFTEVLPATGTTVTGTWKLGYINPVTAAVTYPLTIGNSGNIITLGDINGPTITADGNLQMGATGVFRIGSSRTRLSAPADGQFNINNSGVTAGIGFDVATDAMLKVRTRAQTGYATVDALAYQVSGVAGVSGTITAASTVTVVNGIITVIA